MKPFRHDVITWESRGLFALIFALTLGLIVRQRLLAEEPLLFVAVNTLIMALPLCVAFFAAALLVEALEQHLFGRRLTRRTGAALRWTPRIGLLLFVLFVSLFALDIFGQGYSLWETIAGLTMHLIPTFALLIVLALAWRWPLVGGICTLLLAGMFLLWFGPGWAGAWSIYLLFIGPPVVIGLLFIADWWLRKEIDDGGATAEAGPA